jgi:hypothetical protein
MMAKRVVPGLLLAFVLAGCSHPPPVLSLNGRVCDPTPNLTKAVPLPAPGGSDVSQTVEFQATGACLDTESGPALYAAFALPAATQPYILEVKARDQQAQLAGGDGYSLPAPHLTLLDAAGKPVRAPDFIYRGNGASVLIRLHAEERFVLIASDPTLVGQKESRITETMDRHFARLATWTTGNENQNDYVFSHAGTVVVKLSTLGDAPKS